MAKKLKALADRAGERQLASTVRDSSESVTTSGAQHEDASTVQERRAIEPRPGAAAVPNSSASSFESDLFESTPSTTTVLPAMSFGTKKA